MKATKELDHLSCSAFMLFLRGEGRWCKEKWQKIEQSVDRNAGRNRPVAQKRNGK